MSFGHCWFITLPNHTEFNCFWCWLLYPASILSCSDIVCVAAIGVVPPSSWLRSGLLPRMPCYCELLTLKPLYRHCLKVRGHVCICVVFLFWVCMFALSFRTQRLERSDTIRCMKSCQPGDVACVLDPTLSLSHTFISLPTFREFTKPEGRCKSIFWNSDQ